MQISHCHLSLCGSRDGLGIYLMAYFTTSLRAADELIEDFFDGR